VSPPSRHGREPHLPLMAPARMDMAEGRRPLLAWRVGDRGSGMEAHWHWHGKRHTRRDGPRLGACHGPPPFPSKIYRACPGRTVTGFQCPAGGDGSHGTRRRSSLRLPLPGTGQITAAAATKTVTAPDELRRAAARSLAALGSRGPGEWRLSRSSGQDRGPALRLPLA
jgi:hypothetical protein